MKNLLCLLPLLALSAFAAAPPPANDDFANRTILVSSGSISVSGRNASATTQASEPTISGDIVSRSVWWEWSAPFSGPVTISTGGSSFDTLLGVFTGTALGVLTSIAENDDAGTGAYTSTVNFNAVSGIPYIILVGGFNGAGGKIQLGITVSSGPCSYTVSPTSKSFSSAAGTGSETVTTQTGCSWSAASNDSFIAITSGSTGTGSGTVTYSVTANVALTARTGTMTIAGTTVTISQAAAPACTYSLSPTSVSLSAASVTNTIALTTGTGCAWNATPNASWITIPSGASGTASGTITYVLAANTTTASRTSTITAGGQTFTVTQAGTVSCTYSISPISASVVAAGASGAVNVATIGGCQWTAATNVSWISISTTNGTGNAAVLYTVNANTGPFRTGTLTVAGQTFTVFQAAGTCSYSINPSSINVAATNSSSTVAVAAGAGCAWTAVANFTWLTITAGTSGSGSGSVVFTIAFNPNTVARVGTLTIAGQTFTVNQAAAACIYSITPTAAHYLDPGGPGNIAVTAGAGCAWTAISNDAWISVDSGSPGTASGTVGYTVSANATTVSRTGTITVAGATFTITQDGTVPCAYSISPSSASFTSLGGTNSFAVTANTGCTWSVSSSDPSWLTFSPGSGSGNGTVLYTVGFNSSSLTRTGTVAVAGQTFTVTQTGTTCTYAISPTSASYVSGGGVGTVAVTATAGCNWTSTSDSAWLTVISGSAGTGNGSVGYAVTNNPSSVTRTGRLTIAGKLLIVTQTGISCTFAITPISDTFTDIGGGGLIAVNANDNACAWTATSAATWITVNPASGTGDANVNYTVAGTALATTRTGTLTVAGQTFTVTQTGDTTAPVVTLTSPANGSTISNVVNVAATATDLNMARVDFYRDAAVLIGTDTTTPYSLPFQTTNITDGAHTFYARGFDIAGNQGLSSTSSVTVANGSFVTTNAWAQRFGSTAADIGLAITTDSSANVIAAGAYQGSVNFGTGVFTNAGFEDIFIAKYSPLGVPMWAKHFGDTGRDRINSVIVDTNQDVLVTGFFTGAIDFGGGILTSAGLLDIVMAKYSAAGSFIWAQRFGSTQDDAAYAITVDGGGNVIITGGFQGTVNFGGTNLTASLGLDFFLAKYSATGVHQWSRRAPASGSENGFALATDSNGDIIGTGSFTGSVDFGGGFLATAGQEDIFLVKFAASNGLYIWQQRFGSTASDKGLGVKVDSGNNIALTGYFSGTVDFGGTSVSTPVGATDAFIAKYNSSGTNLWIKRFGAPIIATGYSIAIDSSNNIVATGLFQNTATLDGGQTISSAGGSDVFVTKYSSAGVRAWTKSAGGTSSDVGYAVATDVAGYPVVTGSFSSTGSFNGTSLTSAGLSDIFLMKLSP